MIVAMLPNRYARYFAVKGRTPRTGSGLIVGLLLVMIGGVAMGLRFGAPLIA